MKHLQRLDAGDDRAKRAGDGVESLRLHGTQLVQEGADVLPVRADVEDVGRRAGGAHRQTGIEIVRAPFAQFSADGFQPAVPVAGETPVGQERMVHADRLLARARLLPLAPHVELRVHALDRRRPLRIAGSSQKGKVLVGHAEAARLQFDARLDTVPVPLRAHGEVGFEREPGVFLLQQRRQPSRRERERFNRVATHRQRPVERVRQRADVADPGQRGDGVQQVALAGRVRAEEHRETRELHGHVHERLEVADGEAVKHRRFSVGTRSGRAVSGGAAETSCCRNRGERYCPAASCRPFLAGSRSNFCS